MFLELARRSFFPLVSLAASLTVLLGTPAQAQCVDTVDLSIGGNHNPFLAGQPAGTALGNDMVPGQEPLQVPLSLVGGELMRFVGVDGQLQHEPLTLQLVSGGPEGDVAQMAVAGPNLGISGFHMPVDALLGVFTGSAPNAGTAPAELDFSASTARDFHHLQPALYQIFFIGNGLREDGITLQSFEVPLGATHLYLGSSDFGQWYDNDGALQLAVEQEVADITPYCSAKLSSEGCLPAIDYTGYPAMTGTHEFNIICNAVSPGTKGVLFYGRAQYGAPFQGGLLCTNVMIRRTPITSAPKTLSNAPCSSALLFDFNAWILSGNDPFLMPGDIIHSQWWMRDPGSWSTTGLSDALEIQLCQ
jgi:hypothetical protein